MKKNTIRILANILSAMPEGTMLDNPLFDGAATTRKQIPASELYDELNAELNKGAEKAQANRDLYESAKDTVMGELSMASEAVTIGELWEAVADKLPEGFTKGKLQYAVTRLWASEIEKIEGKVNTYRKA